MSRLIFSAFQGLQTRRERKKSKKRKKKKETYLGQFEERYTIWNDWRPFTTTGVQSLHTNIQLELFVSLNLILDYVWYEMILYFLWYFPRFVFIDVTIKRKKQREYTRILNIDVLIEVAKWSAIDAGFEAFVLMHRRLCLCIEIGTYAFISLQK